MPETNQASQSDTQSLDQVKKDTSLSATVSVRQAIEADVSFIFNSWLKSYQNSQKQVTAPVYFDFQHKLIENILQRSTVLVACDASDAEQIFAYLVFEYVESIPVIHYAYTKHSFRKLGLQKKLLAESGIKISEGCFYTHNTALGQKLSATKKLVYNPYLAYKV